MNIELHNLPEDILFVIWDFIKDTDKIVLCKQFYFRFHSDLYREKYIHNKTYLYFLVKNDYSFILENIISNNREDIIKKTKKFTYKNFSFASKLAFVHHYASTLGSTKCHNYSSFYIKENNLSQFKNSCVRKRKNTF